MRAFFITFFLLCSVSLFAQDIIVKNNGETILSKVVEIGTTDVKYKKYSNLNGPTYTIAKAEILVINYENGEKESFKTAQSSGSVGSNFSSNSGKRILSDNELLRVDTYNNVTPKEVKKLRKKAWIGGIIGVGVGTGIIISTLAHDFIEIFEDNKGVSRAVGGACIIGGAIYAGVNFAKANKLQKELNSYVLSAPIFQESIKFGNGSMLSAGIDAIKGKNSGYTPGLGIRYNF